MLKCHLYGNLPVPSSPSCSVVDAVCSNIDKALTHQILFVVVALMLAYFVMILLSQHLTQIVSFSMRIPDGVDHDPYLLDLFLCSNPDKCSVSPPVADF